MINPEAYYSSERGVTVYPVQMHNASQMSFSPLTGLIYVPINPSSTFSFTAAETFTPNPGNQNLGLRAGGRGGGAGTAPPLASQRLTVPFAGEQMAILFVAEFSPHGTRRHRRNGGTPWAAVRPTAAC